MCVCIYTYIYIYIYINRDAYIYLSTVLTPAKGARTSSENNMTTPFLKNIPPLSSIDEHDNMPTDQVYI
jgi:hypothetical protein